MPDKSRVKQLGRRRVFAFFWALLLIAIANTVNEEGDIFLHVVDDYADIILAVVALIVLVAWWKKSSIPDLKRVNNIMAVLAVLVIIATIYAITQEYTDPADFGNEIPTLLFGIFLLINRFV
jgi:peptidoglycan/LPS O-acetylase OafA/YrhL